MSSYFLFLAPSGYQGLACQWAFPEECDIGQEAQRGISASLPVFDTTVSFILPFCRQRIASAESP
jgi:hypothetical protein